MARNKFLTTMLLWPLSKIYGAIMGVRNWLFDIGVLKQHEFDIPIISVGNIAVGGTGKTPHTEYIVDLLKERFCIGILSRGYKRKTHGFFLADKCSSSEQIGDEPFQMFQKYKECKSVTLAVCENRCEGIKKMKELNPSINLIILDDAFQHRYVKPKISIVLTEYNRPVFSDKIMPLGRLRENIHSLNRADIVIVTKCPNEMKPMDYRVFKNNLNLYPYQSLFFSQYNYGNLISLFPDKATYIPNLEWLTKGDTLLVVTGIANPRPLIKQLKRYKPLVKVKQFEDHHHYTIDDFNTIKEKYNALTGEKKYIITTEKDSVRLIGNSSFPEELKQYIFYIPIKVQFISVDTKQFDIELNRLIYSKKLF
ncbi:MAG: tetraacyldisaccharide 4'-kinase [Muribaculaceae bacterium]|nr:tetraacyldisaccharide 4'-kinase [Muribaculaceae bacterium]